MRRISMLLCGLCLLAAATVFAATALLPDVQQAPSCRHCGMDRAKFSQSRMLVRYEDGSQVATCSLHCTAVELANTIDRIPVEVLVADYNSKALLDSDQAVWVIGGSRKGVMTALAKWAFVDRESAAAFIRENGGSTAGFDEAIKAAYDDMYQDTKMIREFRKMKRLGNSGAASGH